MPKGEVRLVREGAVAVVVLDQPPGNRVSQEMVASLSEAVSVLEGDGQVRAVIVTGAGNASFCEGLDFGEWSGLTPKEAQDALQAGFSAFWGLEHLTKPTVAGIEGPCLGVGAELALACDFRLAGATASFAFPEIDLGWMPSHGGTARLARTVGRGRALEILLSSRTLSAKEAREIGLVDRVLSAGQALEHARSFAHVLAEKPRDAVRAIKRTLAEGAEKPYRNRFLLETQHSVQLLTTEEYRKAMAERRTRSAAMDREEGS